jgi:hypothetical protein
MPRWSPDGASLFFFRDADPPAFVRIPVNGGPATDLIPGWDWGSNVVGGFVDPKGARIAYTAMQGGTAEVARIRDLASGREADVGVRMWVDHWSPDGRRLVMHADDGTIFVCPDTGAECRPVAKGRRARWSGDGASLFVHRRGQRRFDDATLISVDVWSVGVDKPGERRVATLEPQHVLSSPFDVSVDDQIAWIEFRRGKEELWLAELEEP